MEATSIKQANQPLELLEDIRQDIREDIREDTR